MEQKEFLAEEWRALRVYPDYEVSSHGRVRRVTSGKGTKSGRIQKPANNTNGYKVVRLYDKSIYVYELVAQAFLGPRPNWHELHHLDKDKDNDWVYNLKYLPISEHRSYHKMKETK